MIIIKYNLDDGTLLLRDLKSKFGTLILIKNPLKIKEKKIHLQIGRTYIEAWLMSMADFERLKREKKQKRQQSQSHHHHQQSQNQNNENNNMDIDDKNEAQKTHYPGKNGQGFQGKVKESVYLHYVTIK